MGKPGLSMISVSCPARSLRRERHTAAVEMSRSGEEKPGAGAYDPLHQRRVRKRPGVCAHGEVVAAADDVDLIVAGMQDPHWLLG